MSKNPREDTTIESGSSARSDTKGLNRRSFIQQAGVVTGLAATSEVWLSGVARASAPSSTPVLVMINQRGGADGLSILCPVHDTTYTGARSTIVVPPPAMNARAWLDGTFAMSPGGLNASGIDWLTPFENGDLSFVNRAGMAGNGRSHFDSMKHMESGIPPGMTLSVDGWLGRQMSLTSPVSSVRGVSHGPFLPRVLFGAPKTPPVADVAGLAFPGLPASESIARDAVEATYASTQRPLIQNAANNALAALDTLSPDNVSYPTPGSGEYPNTPFGNALANSAAIIKDPMVQVEAIHLDIGGWDHHGEENPLTPGGQMYDLLNELSTAIGAFYNDLGGSAGTSQYLMVVLTEFGRTVAENLSMGTDHGTGGVMAVMGSGVIPDVNNFNKGKIVGGYTDLSMHLDDGALETAIDYRDVMREVLQNQLGVSTPDLALIFPNFSFLATPLGVIG